MTVLHNIRRTFLLLQSPSKTIKYFINMQHESSFVPKRVLIVSKVSKFELEKLRLSNLNDLQLKLNLLERGLNYEELIAHYEKNKNVERQVIDTLKQMNVDYKLTNRTTIQQPQFDWADLVVAIGGDGTFLLAANLIFDNKKPIIGINSDPDTSEGYLMLQSQYTTEIAKIFDQLKNGKFEYAMRTRIRVVLQGEGIWSEPFHVHAKSQIAGHGIPSSPLPMGYSSAKRERRLPWLALNEVFIGESLSARTSSLEIRVDNKADFHKVKCSGICVSTGTGSSSWYKAINSVTSQMVKDVLHVAVPTNNYTTNEIDRICTEFNESLPFPADDSRMSYAIKDIIINDIWPLPRSIMPRSFCNTLTIRSQCYDAGLVFDGGIAVPFNVGTVAILETHSEDALRTIRFYE